MGCFSLRSLLLAAFVISNCITWTASRHSFTHNASGHRRRHRRQGAGLYLPASYVVPGGEGSGGWGDWGEVSPCSRTCGGGVASQKRICLETGPDGRPSCTGGDTKYFSCQTQDCPEETDFRAEQCSAYDDKPFKGLYHKWVPYTNGPRPCELNCMPRAERFYYRHQHKVVDGTRCKGEAFDVCVNGECLPVGCDMMLGSNAREDKCRECRGNGSNCHTNAGLIDSQDFIKGYNDILLIPQGATSISIEEIKESNNYLALRSKQDNKYYLNGDYHIDFPRKLHFAGATWHYERSVQGFAAPDKLWCLGPITEPLYLSLLLQDDNVGVKFEYSIPKGMAPLTDAQYVWVHDDFTPCSVSCGGGFQTRNVTCRSREELEVVDESLCDAGLRPSANESCRQEECAPAWVPSQWGPCSKPCGQGGTRSRQVQCQKIISNGLSSIVDDKQCFDQLGDKPELFQKCNSNDTCPNWFTGPWKPCDKLCGEGKQTRQVVCIQKNNGRVEVLVDGSCADEKPTAEQPCMLHPCEGVDWVVTKWTGCDSCISKVMSREARCTTKDGTVVNSTFCSNHPKPEVEKLCDQSSLPPCQMQWYATQWSNCSVDCGKGVKTRRVFCGRFDGVAVNRVDDEKCDLETKYNDTTPCEVPKELCPAKWFTAPWSECTKKCGGGEQFRRVMCLSGGKQSSACPLEDMVDVQQSCNIGHCDEDDLLPVDSSATTVMDDDDYSDCEDEEVDEDEGEEVGAGLLGSTPLDFMFSDSPGTSGSGYSELETEFTTVSGTETESSDLTEETGSGETDETSVTDESTEPSDVTSEAPGDTVTGSDLTEDTGSTVSGETEATEVSETGATEVSETGATEVSGSDATGLSTESSASGETSESSATEATVSEGSTDGDTAVTSSTEAGDTSASSSSESGSTVTDETGSTEGSTSSATEVSDSSTTISSDSTTESTSSSDLSTTESATDGTTDSSGSTTDVSSETSTETSDSTSASVTDTTDITTTDATSSTDETETTEGDVSGASTETSDITGSTTTDTTESGATEVTSSTESEGTTESAATETSGSTDATETGSTDATSSTEVTETGSTESTETTESGPTTESAATEATESEGTDLTGSTTEGSSTTEVTGSDTTESEGTSSWDWTSTVVTEKRICKPRKRPAKCIKSTFGCCPDKKTPAAGPFDEGCPNPKTCKDTKFGCCPDGVSPAAGKHNKDCPKPKCGETLFGCCKSDNSTPAEGNDEEGCPPPPPACRSSKYGCCKDDKTPATGPRKKGCPETATTAPPTKPTTVKGEDCEKSKFGCCHDNKTAAGGPNAQGCPCSATEFGCCPDGVTPAGSVQMAGCVKSCNTSDHGCCPDGETPAHGPQGEGCCLLTPFGCCPDNYRPADGPHLEGCGCQYAHFGCCPDNVTIARGTNNEGCGCEYSQHGCCPDRHTEATGPDFDGCGCHTYQFGCCPDGVTVAKGPNLQGCDCRQSTHGCCGDGVTAAAGPNREGCDCASSQFGCCPDGITEAQSKNFSGCADAPVNKQAACSLPYEQGPCYNYSVQWFFDMEYGGCSRFHYGGCEGNGNRFANKEECEDVCVRPAKKEVCRLPKVVAGCPVSYTRWYYDSRYQGCTQFQYSGCLGNANNFDTRELCEQQCAPERTEDQCKLPIERGSCRGSFSRFGFNAAEGRCEQFVWGGCEGNANRFISEAACVLQCQPPGELQPACTQPQDVGNCTDKVPAWSFSQTENRCVPFYYTGCGGNDNRYNDEQSCAEACPSAFEQEMCTLPALTGECGNYSLRWFYDTTHEQCRQFYYGGCGGNGNNFQTEQECKAGCVLSRPTTTTPRPAEPEPFREEFCNLEIDPGRCSGNEQRWAYSAERRECVPFQYTGCGGNQNKFPSKEYCQFRCQPQQDICQLPMRVGMCRASIPRWFYDAGSGRCSQFTYGGCDGNANNFESPEECELRCRSPPAPAPDSATPAPGPREIAPECRTSSLEQCVGVGRIWYLDPASGTCAELDTDPGEPSCDLPGVFSSPEACERSCGAFRDIDVCRYPLDPGPCSERQLKYYFDSATGSCRSFTYGGCHGGPNRFSTVDECESICIPDIDPCRLRPSAGNCSGYTVSWYYDEARDDCNQFVYTGCFGNANRFENREECEGQCKRAPSGVATPTPTTTHRTPPASDECAAPPSLAPCGENMPTFYYDASQGRCVSGQFGGCRYPNSYRTEEECERNCGAFRNLDVCRAPLDPGPCREPVAKVYWNLQEGRCAPFTYGGCQGGPNRFSNEDECEEVCGHLAIDENNEVIPECASANAKCAELRCDYGITRTRDADGCARCSCDPHPCAELQCPAGQRCQPIASRGPDGSPKYTAECRPADCLAEETACAALHCEYGVQRSRGADGCERCACVVPETDCRPLEDECRELKCNYGPVTRTRGADGCERCTCTTHPCDGKQCPVGQRCVAAAYRDAVTGDTQYSTDCRPENKPGYCPSDPIPSSSCRVECNDDADCRGVGKCCTSGCSRLCREPAEPTTPIPDGPLAPQVDSATEPEVTATEFGVATLRCLFHSNPPPKITWKKGEITIDGSVGRYRLTSEGALEIVSVYRNDSGVYICVAENELGTAQQEVVLQVNDPVTAPAGIAGDPVAQVIGNIGHPLAIRCLAYGHPSPSIAWYRGPSGPMVPYYSDTYEARGNVLLIRSLGIDTLGEYTCQAYNGLEKPASWTAVVHAVRQERGWPHSKYLLPAGETVAVTPRTERTSPAQTTPQPIVEFPTVPKFTAPVRTSISASQTTLAAGGELNLPCDVDGHPEPRVYWTKDGVLLAPSDRTDITPARLTVSRLTEADSGVYGCHAQNEHSSHHSTVQITVQQLYIPPLCTDNHYFANCKLIVRSNLCVHDYYSKFCCKSCVEAGALNPQNLQLQADQSWMSKK